MKWIAVLGAIALSACSGPSEDEATYDRYLERIIAANNLRPLPTKPYEETPKFKLGQALFFDPILSGNRDISCATCHLVGAGLSDGLPASIGSGGVGLGTSRERPRDRPAQPRNSLDLWNRDNNSVKSMFWDGRAEVLDPVNRKFRTPLGDLLPEGFENLMAVQAIFPLTQADEMLGLPGDASPGGNPPAHAGLVNEIAASVVDLEEPYRTAAVLDHVVSRLIGTPDTPPSHWELEYRRLFEKAFPGTSPEEVSIVHVGNALAHFEEIAFATRDTPWDRYLEGDMTAIGLEAKRGAFLFFGRGRCAVCHGGPLFSDFEFHSIGARPFGAGYDGQGHDTGRFRVTRRPADKFKFRTPPLRNVTLTAPYFHNGSAKTLDEAIRQHADPLQYADKYAESGEPLLQIDEIDSVSPILLIRVELARREIDYLVAFLMALEDDGIDRLEGVVPLGVPSQLPIHSTSGAGDIRGH
ncbi:cytochrome c peroxidase [Oricola sp.]|uniref:cytochrome-c peroxidase n=1 Tax=Oricola sp. TaxID=1979950 RepID=UPI0025DDD26E|nr:cytochrome c peroxidase [Oricola sp.]MCI5073970.1 hypothetical protein [Oricola sp.]